MEITELRIGSWVTTGGFAVKIEGILDDNTVKIDGSPVKLENIEPLYITVELMEHNWVCGWNCEYGDEFGEEPTFTLDSERLMIIQKDISWYLFRTMRNNKKVLLTKLEYAHELQNALLGLKTDCDIDCDGFFEY